MSRSLRVSRRVVVLACGALVVLTGVAWALSGWWEARVAWESGDSSRSICLKAGRVGLFRLTCNGTPFNVTTEWRVEKRGPLKKVREGQDTLLAYHVDPVAMQLSWEMAPEPRFHWGWDHLMMRSGTVMYSATEVPLWPVAALAALPLTIVGGVRWRALSRVRRGLCPSCGYDRRGLADALCPECGAK